MSAGISTGFSILDELTTGLQPGELWVIAALPATGNSSFANSIALNAARRGYGVLNFSLEMTAAEFYIRMLCIAAEINSHKLRTGVLTEHEKQRFSDSKKLLDKLPITVYEKTHASPSTVIEKAKQVAGEMPLDLIVIDTIQLMDLGDPLPATQEAKIASLAKALKSVAVELNVPILTLAHLNRGSPMHDQDAELQLNSIREMGAYDQYADLVAILRRRHEAELPESAKAEIHILKQRNGPVGMLHLTFLAGQTSFGEFSESEAY